MLKTGPRVSRGFLYVSYPPRIELWTLDENSKKKNEKECVKAVLYIVILEDSLYSKLSCCIRFIHYELFPRLPTCQSVTHNTFHLAWFLIMWLSVQTYPVSIPRRSSWLLAAVVNPYSSELVEFSANHAVHRRVKTSCPGCAKHNIAFWKEEDTGLLKESNESILMALKQQVSVAFGK